MPTVPLHCGASTSGRRPVGRRLAGLTLAASIAGTAAGCATDPRHDGLSPREFAAVEHVAVHMAGDEPRQAYQVLERIQGLSCDLYGAPPNDPAHKVVTRYEALYDMQLEAADLGANAVVGVTCRRDTFSQGCFDVIVCTGEAARLDDGVGMDLPAAPRAGGAAKAAGTGFVADAALYESPLGFTPDYLSEAQRAELGTLGLAVPARSPGKTVEAPPSGDEAVYQGAGLWFVQCAAQGGTLGLIISPLCAAIGAGLGALTAESAENVQASRAAIGATLEEYYSHRALRDRVLRVAAESGAPPLEAQAPPLPGDAMERRANPWRFDAPVDSVIEVGVEELLLPAWRSGATTNLPVPLSMRARVRVVRLSDSREIYNHSYRFVSEPRLFRQWGAENGAALQSALNAGLDKIARQIVEDLLFAYPLMPGFTFTANDANERNYVVEPLNPPAHQYWPTGSAQASRAQSRQPTFRWRKFPSVAVLEADFQGKLRELSALRYDLRVYRLDEERGTVSMVLEQDDIEATEYKAPRALAAGAAYIWSVRARFALDAGERTSRWSGDWLPGNVKGFLFRTPG
jgi:Putative heavy-metal-binding